MQLKKDVNLFKLTVVLKKQVQRDKIQISRPSKKT